MSCGYQGKENLEDVKRVKKRMHYSEVQKIMRNAALETEKLGDSLFLEVYQTHPAASDEIRIVYSNRDSTVVDLIYGY